MTAKPALNSLLSEAAVAYPSGMRFAVNSDAPGVVARVAAAKENRDSLTTFIREVQTVLQKYYAAMRQMEVRLQTLDHDLKLRQHRYPIHHIESRMKSIPSIYDKLIRYGKPTTIRAMEENIMDIAGLRVIVSYVQDAYSLLEKIERQDDLQVIKVKDYIRNPKPNGYRSIHLITTIPVYFLDQKENIPVEIQIRTIAMDFWASLEHDLKYKAEGEIEGIDAFEELRECSQIIEGVENRMQVLADALDETVGHAVRSDGPEGMRAAVPDGAPLAELDEPPSTKPDKLSDQPETEEG